MADPKKPENLSPQDLEKPTGGEGLASQAHSFSYFRCPVAGCD